LTQVPVGVNEVVDIRLTNNEIHVLHPAGRIHVPSSGVAESGLAPD
jgi:hypothetical protein